MRHHVAALLLVLLVQILLGLVNEGQNIAHAEDPARHSVRVELLEVGKLLAHTDIQDRLRHIERRCRKFDQFPLAVEHAKLARENRPCRRNRCLIIDSVIVIRSRILAPADPPSGIQAVSADQCVFPVRHQGNISSRTL